MDYESLQMCNIATSANQVQIKLCIRAIQNTLKDLSSEECIVDTNMSCSGIYHTTCCMFLHKIIEAYTLKAMEDIRNNV